MKASTITLAALFYVHSENENGFGALAKKGKAVKKAKKTKHPKSAHNVLTADIGVYPEYTGDITMSGNVEISFDEYAMDFMFEGEGLEADCANCGIHIHLGTTCSDADLVYGHYWAPAGTPDPWTGDVTYYDSDADGNATGDFVVVNGYSMEGNVGHAVVVHASDGSRIGCGVLESKTKQGKSGKVGKKAKSKKSKHSNLSADIGVYPEYTGDITMSGNVEISFDEYAMDFMFEGEGLEADCANCGIHIHLGTTCSDADLVYGHYWAPAGTPDPWTGDVTYYDSDADGNATGDFIVENGYTIEGNVGHAVVVHASDGSRIGCGVLM